MVVRGRVLPYTLAAGAGASAGADVLPADISESACQYTEISQFAGWTDLNLDKGAGRQTASLAAMRPVCSSAYQQQGEQMWADR